MGDISDGKMATQCQDHKALFGSIARAYDSGQYSDLTIQCGSRVWKVHRLIVYSASNYFYKAGEGDFKEGHTKHIELKEMDPDVLDKVLSYIYKHDYQVEAKSAVTLHPEVYKLADYLDMQTLKQVVRKKFSEALRVDWEVASFTKALRVIYTTTPPTDRGLRDIAKAHLGQHKKTLREHKAFTDLVEANFADGRFVMDVLDAWTEYKDAKSSTSTSAAAGVTKKTKAPRARKRNQDQIEG